ncbi:peptidylprolyl isomerase [Dinghuibacter silviterrae]|uniref:Peptidyl-prolyl cis-trans isomerase n=1 Tax=Dinghuibacter silviterrae TaxID=1539049 RepID=A0A4R8DP15_9BACT|nr:peptidylprolyl isomerase [Dinghuibacter silviterrae]TDW99465.1 peptidyl-prolyl cis-trans isomerase B (cyclophilin B) [Dinghuibacter silviterrae]
MRSLFLCLLFIPVALFARPKRVKITTTAGVIVVELYDQTPKHRDNFLKLVRKHVYDSALFHRVIPHFMIQGGDPTSKHAAPGTLLGNGDVGYTIPAEFDTAFFHVRGTLAAARDDNPAKASSGCQFYIVQGKKYTDAELDALEKGRMHGQQIPWSHRQVYKTEGGTPWLDRNYTVFGRVVSGMDVVDNIASVKTDGNNRPVSDVRILKMRVIRKFLFF